MRKRLYLIILALTISLVSLFFLLFNKHYETLHLNEVLTGKNQLINSLKQQFSSKDSLVAGLQSDLSKLTERNYYLNDFSRGDWLNLKENEYSVPTLKIGDKFKNFKLTSLSPFLKDIPPHSFNAILKFEGSTSIEGEVYESDWGTRRVCLKLLESSIEKVPNPVGINGYKVAKPVCSSDKNSVELLEDLVGKTVNVKIEGYSELLCECDVPRDNTIFKKLL